MSATELNKQYYQYFNFTSPKKNYVLLIRNKKIKNINVRLYILSYKVALSFVGYIGIICILYWINLHQHLYHLSLLIRVRINLG